MLNYFIGWTLSYVFIYHADSIFIGKLYEINFNYYLIDLIKVWSGNAFVKQAFIQYLAVFICLFLTLLYWVCLKLWAKGNK